MSRNKILTFIFIGLIVVAVNWGFNSQLGYSKITKAGSVQGSFETQKLNSPYALLVEADSGRALMSKNANQRMYPASMTKIMTALIAIEELQDLNELVYLDFDMFHDLQVQGAALAGFAPGEWVPAIDLLYGMMLPSGAECAIGIARHVAGSEEDFVQLMNQKADELGLAQTHYMNPIGLHHPNHYSTAEDMVKLLRYALNNEFFRELFTAEHYTVTSGLSFGSTVFDNLPRKKVENGEIIGGRTGYTMEAGRCLISLANINGKEYILVTAGAENSENNTIRHLLDALYIYDQI